MILIFTVYVVLLFLYLAFIVIHREVGKRKERRELKKKAEKESADRLRVVINSYRR